MHCLGQFGGGQAIPNSTAAGKIRIRQRTRRAVVVPQSLSSSRVLSNAGARATTQLASAAVRATSQSEPSVATPPCHLVPVRLKRGLGHFGRQGGEAPAAREGREQVGGVERNGSPAGGLEVEESATAVSDVRVVRARVTVHEAAVAIAGAAQELKQ